MIVKSGSSILNKSKSVKALPKKSSDSKEFSDLLSSAQSRKKSVAKKKVLKNQTKKKVQQNDIADTSDPKTDIKKRDKKKITNEDFAKKLQPTNKSQNLLTQEKENNKNLVRSTLGLEKGRELTEQNIEGMINHKGAALKNLNSQEKPLQNPLSLNLSDNHKNTLAKSEQILEKIENQMSTSLPMQKNGKQDLTQLDKNSINPSLSQKLNFENGKVKLEAPVKIEKVSETTLSEIGGQNKVVPFSFEKSSDETGQQSQQDLQSLFSQYIEQDQGTYQSIENSQFADEMNQVQQGKSADKIENMQSIVKQARAFVDDGGGSMEIHLQPEGLGKVHLKVAVDRGQVNVEMMADNPVAKRALEEGLVDIKSVLEGQKLLVETLKVEMSPDYQKDFSDLANHTQEQENRDFAQDFLGQFQQSRDQRLGGLFDSFRSFQPGPQEPELSLNRHNPYASSGKGTALNVVA